MNTKLYENIAQIYTPIGFSMGIKMHSKKGYTSKTPIISGTEVNEYVSLFNEDDVDFSIELDNRYGSRGIRITIIINDQNHSFYISPGELSNLNTLKNNGRKLHFLSQNSEDGNVVVTSTAQKYGTTIENASIMCSKILFCVEVEKLIEKVNWKHENQRGNRIYVNIETLSGKNTYINIGSEDLVLDLKKKFAEMEGVSNKMNLIHNSKLLEDFDSLNKYGIKEGSVIFAANLDYQRRTFELSVSKYSHNAFENSSNHCLSTVTDGINEPMKLRSLGGSDNNYSLAPPTFQRSDLTPNDRAVICYGEKSNQKFDTYTGFIKDYSLLIKDFVIELKFKCKYKPV